MWLVLVSSGLPAGYDMVKTQIEKGIEKCGVASCPRRKQSSGSDLMQCGRSVKRFPDYKRWSSCRSLILLWHLDADLLSMWVRFICPFSLSDRKLSSACSVELNIRRKPGHLIKPLALPLLSSHAHRGHSAFILHRFQANHFLSCIVQTQMGFSVMFLLPLDTSSVCIIIDVQLRLADRATRA